MRILLSGSGGFIGSALVARLAGGARPGAPPVEIVRLTRAAAEPGAVCWDPLAGRLDPAAVERFDAVVHLAGENLGTGRWTAGKKTRILQSRVAGTRLLAETIARLDRPPKVFCAASAVGYYGNRGDEVLDESSPPGSGFLAEVCRQWEAATEPAADAGVRVVRMRLGVVLDPAGGALAKMLLPFRLGLGGRLGSGLQYLSWITRADAVRAIEFLLAGDLSGPVNVVAPEPATNREFTRSLGQALRRPTLLAVPALALKLILGEMAREMLLASTRAVPRRLQEAGFAFEAPDLAGALRGLLSRDMM